MLTKEAILEIMILHRQGLGIRAIAQELKISRNTVRGYLRGDRPRKPATRGPGRPRKLEAYEDWLRRRVETARPHRIPATVLFRELSAMGYRGTERTVRRFVATLYPPSAPEPVTRYETSPGHQVQMDWGEYRFFGQKVYSFVAVLGYSRWMYLEYVDNTRSEVLLDCHRRMLQDFGGVPREILYDNMRTVVTKRDAYGRGRHRFQDAFWTLAKEYAFRPVLCRPYRPQTKGKVERSIHYVANSFFYPLVTRLAMEERTLDVAGLNAEARLWTGGVANVREHGTTGVPPRERLVVDQRAMQPYVAEITPKGQTRSDAWPRYPLQRSPREYDAVLEGGWS